MKGNFSTDPEAGQILIGQANMTYEPRTLHGDVTVDTEGNATVSGGGGSGISGLTEGFIPLAGSATTINANSHIDDGVTVADTLTASEPLSVQAHASVGLGSDIDPLSTLHVKETLTADGNGVSVELTWNPTVDSDTGVVADNDNVIVNADGQSNNPFVLVKNVFAQNQSETVAIQEFEGMLINLVNNAVGEIFEMLGLEFFLSNNSTGVVDSMVGIRFNQVAAPTNPPGNVTAIEINLNKSDVSGQAFAINCMGGDADNDLGSGTTALGLINQAPAIFAVADLPPVTSAGMRAFASDALTPVFGAIVAGGGAVLVPVYTDDNNWLVG